MIRDFIAALGLSDVTLVGNDTGGGLCQLVIDAYPDQVGRLVLTNCDAFDKFPPFPFTLVFALLRGPISIKLLFEQMRMKALRHSPLGFGLLVTSGPATHRIAGSSRAARDARIRRDLATLLAQRRQDRSDRRVDAAPAVHQAGDDRVGSARPVLQAVAWQAAGGAVPELLADRGARRAKRLCRWKSAGA